MFGFFEELISSSWYREDYVGWNFVFVQTFLFRIDPKRINNYPVRLLPSHVRSRPQTVEILTSNFTIIFRIIDCAKF